MKRLWLWLCLLVLLPAGAGAQEGGIRMYPAPCNGRMITYATPNVTTTGLVEETLATVTIPAGLLARDGDMVVLRAVWTTAANANTKNIRFTANSVSIGQTATTANSGGVASDFWCMRATSTLMVCSHTDTNTSAATPVSLANDVPVASFAAALPILVQAGTPTAIGDITLVTYRMDYWAR